jgi:hypothetical protein
VIFQHLLELSDGKINLFTSNEELSNSQNLMKVNKKVSNKSQFGNPASKTVGGKVNFKKKISNPKNNNRK